MNLKQIEAFVHAARSGGVSAAARKLNTTQPAISMRVKELERSLNAQLLDRSRRRIRLTPRGREFLEYAEHILAMTEEARSRFGATQSVSGRIRLGVTETVALTWLPDLVSRINTEFPEVVVELDVDLTAGVWSKLNAGDLEIALMPGPAQGPGLVAASLGYIRYDWMASTRLDIPDGELQPQDLARWPIITLAQESNLHDVIDVWFHRHNLRPRRIDVCNSLGVVASLTKAGLGISLLPPSVLRDERDRGELRLLETAPRLDDLEFQAVYPRNAETPLIKFVADMAHEVSTFGLKASERSVG
ncbi:MAG: LysR family transcriptional regulator [Rhodospirillaceae bacterium]|jgi:DNA-binding transcriptional LysR family regulator|nr:LysR family transcriptional regulator [Rhodospirillaceae bacterium]MBT5297284.1 LysR family transcriptional regulator [Rhodospirillaceae bacterium]MBT5514333.1 LysR family transcriptional regulator [Rhodospirillaceae bacterium]MBT6085156.1 LysR family transcriptional regulator [Rhodospirillaceae bacterium]MBT6607952.1 LysR family transcriptional regulator [Rhodospirillaceae bacterium]